MSQIKTLIFVLTFLAANCIMVDGKCEVLQGHGRHNYHDIAGKWILGSGPKILLRVFQDIEVNVMSGPGKDELTVTGNATLLRRLTPNFHIPVSLKFLLTFPEKNSSLVEAHGKPPFTIVPVLFRQKEPTQQCVEETKAAFENAGLDYNNIVPDSTLPFKW
ncbi:hypothetical protein C0J52_17477 [Blattella germanica]|nr:hypothetical protein C0J52_17477 [Blattella germanica]